MASTIVRRVSLARPMTTSLLQSQRSSRFLSARASTFLDDDWRRDRIQLSPLFQETGDDGMKSCRIELVDDSTWNVSSGLANAWRCSNGAATLRMRPPFTDHEPKNDDDAPKENLDFDDIEDMRIRGNLFYKLDRTSKEYDEYKFDFHGSKSARNERDRRERSKQDAKKEESTPSNPKKDYVRKIEKSEDEIELVKTLSSWLHEIGNATRIANKKERTPTFNQLTAPYHEPFCLDVFISKGSVRACIVHRATSNVVVVAHSISKDMKFDLGSTKNKDACAAVGRLLAQRALDDDIHNVVFTPRKGERVEGKLQIVVKAIVDGGVDVKVKLKQRSFKQAKQLMPETRNLHSTC